MYIYWFALIIHVHFMIYRCQLNFKRNSAAAEKDWSTKSERVVRASQRVDNKLYIPETEQTLFLKEEQCWRKLTSTHIFAQINPTLCVQNSFQSYICWTQRNFFQNPSFYTNPNFQNAIKIWSVDLKSCIWQTLFPWNILINWPSYVQLGDLVWNYLEF